MAEGREFEFQIYNSMTKQKEKFNPIVPGKVSMYVCGVTSYDFSHIGHARAYVAFDVLFRYLKHLGYEVKYVRNFTDVDDKIIKRANEIGEDPLALSGRFCEEFLIDMADLQCLPPNEQPRVSDHMDQIRDMIEKIISKNCAYAVDGDVYFSVDNFPSYGRLSGRKLEDNRAGERIAIDSRKRNPADFALWKAAKPGEISWESPWGPGRPGWHIECSAMSAAYLTEKFDIHGGGMDLIFPHHENEIAQSCAACPNSNISYWMHNGFVTANDEKMSKSVGNFFTIREVTKLYHPLALRHFLMGTHYRSPVNYSIGQIEISSEAVFYIYQTLEDCESAISQFQEGSQKDGAVSSGKKYPITDDAKKCIKNLQSHFEEKMSDDLHTPSILNAALQDALRLLNKILSLLKKKLQKPQKLSNIQSLIELEKEVRDVLDVLGLLSSSKYTEVLMQLKEKALKRAEISEEDIFQRIEERALARKNKNFKLGDQIRSELTCKGIALMDVGNETIWRPCVPTEPSAGLEEKQGGTATSADGQLQVPPKTSDSQQSADVVKA
ncbi:cysteine--tRNA ligase 2, cytoplasmic-like [Cynara cardunculus var. scolymus]|uniref:cysteine--tRNA ligase 2, cytoplasmic-like n=1 Tax=Cynara cardunculus var. scolymus TaxID=59895 RepID=UPI000D628912|nr:cysteine--tRNA ligase 2, cytoplasmic-like [Cynara cardunculus var. scolymus]XP_024988200.1 cysteine--tRNA ligase 2, cytoplasmic-like [Cynara cardunculus var. scolymus]